tara:strand:- start:918 stop:1040 length:123 start_codon:yes stop_codon:yes gene_type:complete
MAFIKMGKEIARTVIEEEDYLTLRYNKNDKVYKLGMEEIE